MSQTVKTLLGLLLPLAGTVLGSATVFFFKRQMGDKVQKALLGFASGVMIAASVWSLLIPAIEMAEADGGNAWLPAVLGFLLGMGFLLLLDTLIPHLHLGEDKPEGRPSSLGKSFMLVLAVTLHFLQFRNCNRKQLHNDGGVDGGLHTQGEQRAFAQSAAAHHIQILQHIAGAAGKHRGQCACTNVRHRNRTAKTEQDEDQKGEQKTLAQIFNLPCVTEGFQHLTSPQPSRPLSRFFPWRRLYKQRP